MTQTRLILSGMQTLMEDEWVLQQAIIIEEGVIKAILPEEMIKHHLPAKQYKFPNNYYLIPGLIDLHIHGADGYDVMDGNVEALQGISRVLAAEGVTGFLATTMTASNKRIELVLKTIATAMKEQIGAAILGAHLEGPFISSEKLGAQSSDAIELPDPTRMQRWQEIANGAIKIVTLAPELPNAISLIKILDNMGVTISVGHTNATYEQTCNAISAGCSHATHLFNAMRGLHQREPGAAGALLLADAVNAELIVDGLHLHPAMVELALRVKGKNKLLLVTDAMRAKCLQDGDYELGGQMVTVRQNKVTLADGILAGSTLRMPQAIKNMVKFTQCSLADAVSMASTNPARILGLSQRKGSIANGNDADLVVMNESLDVMLTLRDGIEVFAQ